MPLLAATAPASGAAPARSGSRRGIFDNLGAMRRLVIGAAVDPTGNNLLTDEGATSVVATIAVTGRAPGRLSYPGAPPRSG